MHALRKRRTLRRCLFTFCFLLVWCLLCEAPVAVFAAAGDKPPASSPTRKPSKPAKATTSPASEWHTRLEYVDLGSDTETWIGYDFKYPANSYLIASDFTAGPQVHHLDMNCCAPSPDVKTRLVPGVDATVARPTTRDICGDHLETLVWTSPQTNQLVYPRGAGLAVGPGTVCEYGFLQAHLRESTKGLIDTVTGVNLTFTSTKPTSFVQVFYTVVTPFRITRGSGNWLVSGTFKYAPQAVDPAAPRSPLRIFAIKLHTHNRGRRVRLYRLRGNEQTLLFSGDPVSQDWFPMKTEALIEKHDSLIVECAFERDAALDVSTCDATHCEMCWVYWQVTTTSVVSTRIHNDFGFNSASLVSRPVTLDDDGEIGGQVARRERSTIGDVIVGLFVLASVGSIVYILFVAKRRFSATKGYAVMGEASSSRAPRVVSAEEDDEDRPAARPAGGA